MPVPRPDFVFRKAEQVRMHVRPSRDVVPIARNALTAVPTCVPSTAVRTHLVLYARVHVLNTC